MKIYLFLSLVAVFFGDCAVGQMLKSATECETILGKPIKVHSANPPARLYLYKGLHVQISYQEEKAVAAIYRMPSPSGNLPLPESKVNEIFALNGFTESDLVEMDSRMPKEVQGLYKVTKDKTILVLNDPHQNVIVMHDAITLMRHLEQNSR